MPESSQDGFVGADASLGGRVRLRNAFNRFRIDVLDHCLAVDLAHQWTLSNVRPSVSQEDWLHLQVFSLQLPPTSTG